MLMLRTCVGLMCISYPDRWCSTSAVAVFRLRTSFLLPSKACLESENRPKALGWHLCFRPSRRPLLHVARSVLVHAFGNIDCGAAVHFQV